MYFVYILKSKKYNRYYTGCTSNLITRLKRHNAGKCKYTKKFRPWIIHLFEKYPDKKQTFAREKYLKSHAGRNWIKKILGP